MGDMYFHKRFTQLSKITDEYYNQISLKERTIIWVFTQVSVLSKSKKRTSRAIKDTWCTNGTDKVVAFLNMEIRGLGSAG